MKKMEITEHKVTIHDLANGYLDRGPHEGVVAYGGKLDVRPPYQREFRYKGKQREEVIKTIMNDCPLNVMYWSVRDDGNFEMIDGQQRTISICQYVTNVFYYERNKFHSLAEDIQQKILDYELTVFFCEGTHTQKLEWFRTINIAGEKLTNQELLNAFHTGPWLTDAKKWFSKPGCPAQEIGGKYLNGTSVEQSYLETAIKWINSGKIEEYMSDNQPEENANELWNYFDSVIKWVKATFVEYRKEMKGINWGFLYNEYKNHTFDPVDIEKRVSKLMQDDDLDNQKGIYEYILSGNEKHLNFRAFRNSDKRKAYEKQKGDCAKCGKHFAIEEMEADHITPWSKGGKTEPENCQMLCRDDNRRKSNK